MVEHSLARRGSLSPLRGAVVLGVIALGLGCGRSGRVTPRGDVPSDGGDTGIGTGGSGVTGGRGGSAGSVASGGSAGSGTGGTAGAGGEPSEPTCGVVPSGVVRLSLTQAKTALTALLGAPAVEELTLDLDIPTNEGADFPILASEGQAIDEVAFGQLDRMAQGAGKYVRDHLEEVTGCGTTPTDECARAFLTDFAERAFRKAAEGPELELVLGVYDGARSDLGASVEEALEAGVYSVLESPRFTYRFELGAPGAVPGTIALEPHEIASALAFFLTAGPPDAELIAAAATGALSSPADLEPHVARLLATDAARSRLGAAVGTHFGVWNVRTAVFDGTQYPTWTIGLANAMAHETRDFLATALWNEPLGALLTSRVGFVNEALAGVYAVPFPPPDDALDGDGFGHVELPANRAGLLTQASVLAAHSRPNGPSVISRGIWVAQRVLCRDLAPFPEMSEFPQEIQDQAAAVANGTAAEQAAFRMETPECAGCHVEIDPYGLALEEFDGIGAFRQVDPQGRPISSSATLPIAVGGATVANAADLGRALADRDELARCLGSAFLNDALSGRWQIEALPAKSCEAEELVREYAAGSDQSFGGLIRAIALFPAFRERTKSEMP
jgi:hypothetical protein